MLRFELLNALVKAHGYTSYLEIGVESGYTFDRVAVQHKVGVDPNGLATLQLTSDEFFAANLEAFDLIFVDGCHEEHQAYRDMVHALAFLRPGGTVVVHDCLPSTRAWEALDHNGTVWRAWARLRANADLDMRVVDTDHGCGVLRHGKQAPAQLPETLTWDYFEAHRQELMNVVSVAEFVASLVPTAQAR